MNPRVRQRRWYPEVNGARFARHLDAPERVEPTRQLKDINRREDEFEGFEIIHLAPLQRLLDLNAHRECIDHDDGSDDSLEIKRVNNLCWH